MHGEDVSNIRLDSITEKIIGAAISVHRVLGPGLLESAYEECLCYELSQMGLAFGASGSATGSIQRCAIELRLSNGHCGRTIRHSRVKSGRTDYSGTRGLVALLSKTLREESRFIDEFSRAGFEERPQTNSK